MSATTRTTILIDRDLLDRLDRHARRSKSTKTAVIAAALEAYLAEHETSVELGFLAVGRSGHGRLSIDGRSIVRADLARDTAPSNPARRRVG